MVAVHHHGLFGLTVCTVPVTRTLVYMAPVFNAAEATSGRTEADNEEERAEDSEQHPRVQGP